VTIALKNKVVVVIGATTGIGLAATKAILAAGGKVVGVGKDDASGKKAAAVLGADAEILTADASDPATAELAVSTAIDTFGRFAALYHVAAEAPALMATVRSMNSPMKAWISRSTLT